MCLGVWGLYGVRWVGVCGCVPDCIGVVVIFIQHNQLILTNFQNYFSLPQLQQYIMRNNYIIISDTDKVKVKK